MFPYVRFGHFASCLTLSDGHFTLQSSSLRADSEVETKEVNLLDPFTQDLCHGFYAARRNYPSLKSVLEWTQAPKINPLVQSCIQCPDLCRQHIDQLAIEIVLDR